MRQISRYAIYYAPAPGPFARTAAAWLGRDPATGRAVAQPPVPDLAALTAAPRRYGFHGTLKAPFRLAPEVDRAGLMAAVEKLAANLAPVSLPGLDLAELHGFLALVPQGDTAPLAALAARVVEALEPCRAPLTKAEITRRRPERLDLRGRELLARYGYPHVMERFAFHLTLSGPMARPGTLIPAARTHFAPSLPRPFLIDALCVFGEAEGTGAFHLLGRIPLSSAASIAANA
ncbi:MAG TPA: DUF1045 domain-containing protein [Paracoccus sp.]|nr:DUF1045 domain-containing protein [Paracoccus sp. (in: a-proteobacteria)]